MSITKINPKNLYDGSTSRMSQATISEKLGLVFVSGQVDWSTDFEVKNKTLEGQTESAMTNLKSVLEASASSLNDLLQVRVYVRGEASEHMEHIMPVLMKYLATPRPALTGIGVTSLASPDMLIEIEAIAQISE